MNNKDLDDLIKLNPNVTIEVNKEIIDSTIKINPNWIENAIIVGNVFGGRVGTKLP